MSDTLLDRLLTTLDIDVEAFAVCEVPRGRKLVGRGVPQIEIHYVLAGTMYLAVPGSPVIECSTGSVVVVPPRTAQTIGADTGEGADLLAIDHVRQLNSGLAEFDVTDGAPSDLRFVCGLVQANLSGAFGLLDAMRVPIVENLASEEGVRSCFRMMAVERDKPGVGSRAVMGALMKTCLLMALRRHLERGIHESSLLPTLRDPRLGRAVAAVLDRPAAQHSVSALAAVAGMSRSAFAREFSAVFMMSPMEFVARTRLRRAADMLRSTNMPVKQVAASIGFSSRSHFSRAFRQDYGIDPTAYRRTLNAD